MPVIFLRHTLIAANLSVSTVIFYSISQEIVVFADASGQFSLLN